MKELGFPKCENIASYHKKETLSRVIYFFFKCVGKPNSEEYVKIKLLVYCSFRYLHDPAGVALLIFMLNDGVTIRQRLSLRDPKGLSQDGGWVDFHKNLCASLFNKYLSNEPNFSQIHLANQYL